MSKDSDSLEEKKIVLEKKLNSVYYKDGQFNEDAAKGAFAELFAFHRYSLGDAVLNNKPNATACGDAMWIFDFGLGDFTNVGVGGFFFVKDLLRQYYIFDLYLLPFQLVPEHYYPLEGEDDSLSKVELRHVRHGDIWIFPQGGSEPNLVETPPDVAEAIQGQLTAKAIHGYKGNRVNTGEIYQEQLLHKPHWVISGAQGAILSMYTTFNVFDGPIFSNQSVTVPQNLSGVSI